jgi:hypothetical protein
MTPIETLLLLCNLLAFVALAVPRLGLAPAAARVVFEERRPPFTAPR